MPGLFVAAELILTCNLTESPWIIIFGSDRQVENAGEQMLIRGCVSKTREETMASVNEWMKSLKKTNTFSQQIHHAI